MAVPVGSGLANCRHQNQTPSFSGDDDFAQQGDRLKPQLSKDYPWTPGIFVRLPFCGLGALMSVIVRK